VELKGISEWEEVSYLERIWSAIASYFSSSCEIETSHALQVPGKSGRRDRMLRETRRRKWKEGERNDGGRKEGKGEGLERRDQGNLEELIAHGQKVSFLPVKLSRKARMR